MARKSFQFDGEGGRKGKTLEPSTVGLNWIQQIRENQNCWVER